MKRENSPLRRIVGAALAMALVACLPVASSSAAATRGLGIGFADPLFGSGATSAQRATVLDGASSVGGGWVRITAQWRDIAPASHLPLLFDPGDPASLGYHWGGLDQAVRDATEHGMSVMLTVVGAPDWAEGANPPATVAAGAWRPDPTALNSFAHALALRYSGRFPDPADPGHSLPAVRYFQAWNEPNLASFLAPQVVAGAAISPILYRAMLNSFYAGIKSVSPSDVVITAGTAPYGDDDGVARLRPIPFLAGLLCTQGGCRDPAHFDVLAHHPINAGRPSRHAENPNDATTPDIDRIRAELAAAEAVGMVQPTGPKPIWATELWWDSDPPRPNAISQAKQARWVVEALYLLWQQRVPVVFLLRVNDGLPTLADPTGYGSGMFSVDGRPKPLYRALRFPFVAQRIARNRVRVWGLAPVRGRVKIVAARRGGRIALGRIRAAPGVPFSRVLRLRGGWRLRALCRGRRSLVFDVSARAGELR